MILNKVLDSQTLTLRLKGIGDATTYCPDDNEMKIGFETSKLVNLQSKGIIYLLEVKFVQTIVLQHCLDLIITVWNI